MQVIERQAYVSAQLRALPREAVVYPELRLARYDTYGERQVCPGRQGHAYAGQL